MHSEQYKLSITLKMKKILLLTVSFVLALSANAKPKFDYSVVFVPEEGGVKFERITEDADCVADHDGKIVTKNSGIFGTTKVNTLSWWIAPQIAISPDGTKLAYINQKNNTTNVMVKSAQRGGASLQRTFRTNVDDISWSPDGKTLCFGEYRGGHHGIYLTNSEQGAVVLQVSGSNDNDYGGIISRDGNTIFFHRGEGYRNFSLWSYDRKKNLFSNYSRGMSVCPVPGNNNLIYCARFTNEGLSEIWRLNLQTGVEELILSSQEHSFTCPQLSPDGKWLLVAGNSRSEKEKIDNVDIFVVRVDGSQLTQLTYHPGHDLSPVWSKDGKSIFFLSQRGSATRTYNIWRMDFNLYE